MASTPQRGKAKNAAKAAPATDKPKKIGRPSKYTDELATKICLLLAQGLSLRKICLREDMPQCQTVHNWIIARKEFFEQYARAREAQADLLFDQCLEISDDASKDLVDVPTDAGFTAQRVDHEHIARSKLRVDTRKWMAGKLAPKKYGERIAHEIGDPEGKPLSPTIVITGRPQSAPAPEAVGGVRDSGD